MANRVIYTKLPNGQVERLVVGGAGGVGGGATGNNNTVAGSLSPTMKTAYKDLAKSNSLTPSSTTVTPQKINSSTVKQTVAQAAATAPSPAQRATQNNAAASTPYMSAYNQAVGQLTSNANAQTAAARQNYNTAAEQLRANDAAWKAGQAEVRDAYLKRMAENQEADRAASNAQYDKNATQNYINYMRAQKQLPEQLNALGIRGGASESSLIRMGTNYGTNVANNETARAQALDSIAKQYADQISEYETAYKQALLSRDDATASQLATMLNSLNDRLAEIDAAKNDAVTSAYMTALQNDIEYKQNQDAIAREDKIRKETIAREDAIRKEDIAREDARNAIADKRYETEYKDTQKSKMVEQYAAGLTRWKSVDTLKKKAENIKKKHKDWKTNPYYYGQIQAINARIGEIRNGNK